MNNPVSLIEMSRVEQMNRTQIVLEVTDILSLLISILTFISY